MKILFTVPGEPVGKARPCVTVHGTYTPKKTREYEKLITKCWEEQSGEMFPDDVPLKLNITMFFGIPKSYSKKKKAELIGKMSAKRPDVDNVCKAVQDALNGYAYKDDSVICQLSAVKKYAETPRMIVVLESC